MLRHLAAIGRKPTTLATYGSIFRTHLQPQLGETSLEGASSEQIEELAAQMRRQGKAAKTIANALTLLFQIFAFGQRKGWCRENPCASVERPQVEQSADIRFLNPEEFEALLRAVDPKAKPFGHTDCTLAADGSDDWPATGRAARAALARRRLEGGQGPGAPELRPRALGHTEVPARLALGTARRPGRRRARPPLQALPLPGR